MKKLTYTLCLATLTMAATTLFTACDGGSSSDPKSDSSSTPVVERGLNLTAITEDPTGTPGFPYFLSSGETIEFTPDNVVNFPLGTWDAEGSGQLRQRRQTDNAVEVFVGEESFRYYYLVRENAEPTEVSDQDTAIIEEVIQHRFDADEFEERMQEVIDASSDVGSLGHTLNATMLTSTRERIIADSISSIGMMSVIHPDFGLVVRTDRTILLTLDSTNADLAGDNPQISGTYALTDTWQGIDYFADSVQLNPIDINNEQTTGTFSLHLNSLVHQP